VQPHPEFNGSVVSDFVSLRKGTADYPDAMMDDAVARAAGVDHNQALADKIAAFFKAPREVAHAS